MKIGVLGNCQAHGVAQCIRLFAPEAEVTSRSVSLADGDDSELIETIAAQMADCDLALIQTLEHVQPRLANLFTTALERSAPRVLRWPPIIFRGFHPDCVYVMRHGQVLDGIVGPYHSALLCASWSEGLSPARAARLFNSFSYAALGYFEAFDEAAALLTAQAENTGFDLSAFLTAPAAPFMHTINHPTIDILQAVAAQALDRSGITRAPTAAQPSDALAGGDIWPVYPELAHRRGWPFSPPASWDGLDMPLAAVRAYAALERYGDRTLGDGDGPGEGLICKARQFIQAHVIGRE